MYVRFAAVLLAALLVAAGSASAQVAAPMMNPVITPFGAPTNPGVLSWDVPSRVAVSYSPTNFEAPTSAFVPASPFAKGSIRAAVATWVGQRFAVGAAQSSARLEGEPTTPGSFRSDATVVEVAVNFAERLALGIGHNSSKESAAIFGAPDQKETSNEGGLSWRVADALFLGGAAAHGSLEEGTESAGRNARRAGLGFYSRGKGGGVHLEAYAGTTDAVVLPSDSSAAPKVETTGATVELLWGPVLIGGYGRRDDKTDFNPANNTRETSTTAVLGYVPEAGWSIVLATGNFRTDNTSGVETFVVKTTTLGIGYLF
jgi:hypothetical protein